jgi:hypothetical protein
VRRRGDAWWRFAMAILVLLAFVGASVLAGWLAVIVGEAL